MNLSDNLKKIRKQNNLSQEDLADKLGVSRQSVSKWESGTAYPEMDKIIQLSKMFHVNIDELLNQDIGEVKKEKDSRVTINKYIDSFLSYVTETVELFSSMKNKARFKLIIEQCFIVLALIIFYMIIGGIGSFIINNVLSILPNNIYYFIRGIIVSIYTIIYTILAVIIVLHIFKTRYLDYYEVVTKEDTVYEKEKGNPEKSEIVSGFNKEKIIIRDPNHSEYKFIKGLFKCIIFCLKIWLAFVTFWFCISLVCLVFSLVLSFTIIKTGLLFLGVFIAILAAIICNLVILIVLINFIIDRKNNKRVLLITFLISLILCGIGSGLVAISLTNFNYIDDFDSRAFMEDEIRMAMQDNLFIHENYYEEINYIEENRDDVRIVCTHSKLDYVKSNVDEDGEVVFHYFETENIFDQVREILKDINNKEIINYSKFKIDIYASKENIDKLKENQQKYQDLQAEESNYLTSLEEQLEQKEAIIDRITEELETKNNRIDELEEELKFRMGDNQTE